MSEFGNSIDFVALMHNQNNCLAVPSQMLVTPSNFALVNETRYNPATEPDALKLQFRGAELLVNEAGTSPATIAGHSPTDNAIVVGRWQDRLVVAEATSSDTPPPEGTRWAGLRGLFGVMSDDLVAIAGRAGQLIDWDRTHRYCGVCATPTQRDANERSRRCPVCKYAAYPRISPAMMCLVTRGKEILLARNVNFPAGRYSALAGFLEAGESIEEAICREVREEVGIEIKNPAYFASQSWPFPHSLMIAFTAEYAGGELAPNGHEIAEAGWFSGDSLPQLPPRISIARALIEHTLAQLSP